MKFVRVARATVIAASLYCCSVRAQDWSIPGAAAIPERTAAGANKTTPVFDPVRGSGVWFVPGVRGRAVLYFPVTVADKTVLRSMSLRVAGVASGYIKADLFEESGDAPPVRLGALAVTDRTTTGSFVLQTSLLERTVSNLKNSYAVRIEMCNDSLPSAVFSAAQNPAVYSLHLGPERCNCAPPGPPPLRTIPVRTCKVQ